MGANKPPKNIRRTLKELSWKSYEIELREHLGNLFNNFKTWDNNKLKSGELSDLIHEFHDGPSREMYKYYNTVDPEMSVSRAIVLEYFSSKQIPEEVFPFISNSIEFCKKQYKL